MELKAIIYSMEISLNREDVLQKLLKEDRIDQICQQYQEMI